jgi:hypothetical protein
MLLPLLQNNLMDTGGGPPPPSSTMARTMTLFIGSIAFFLMILG